LKSEKKTTTVDLVTLDDEVCTKDGEVIDVTGDKGSEDDHDDVSIDDEGVDDDQQEEDDDNTIASSDDKVNGSVSVDFTHREISKKTLQRESDHANDLAVLYATDDAQEVIKSVGNRYPTKKQT